jgi:hypothetical protein
VISRKFVNYLGPYFDPIYENTTNIYGSAFLRGAQANNYAANATNCFNRAVNFWFTEVPLLQWRYFYGSFDDNLFNMTQTISNGTNFLMICFDALENFSIFALQKVRLFPDFTSLVMAFF